MNLPAALCALLDWGSRSLTQLSEKLGALDANVTLPPGEWDQMVEDLRREKARADAMEAAWERAVKDARELSYELNSRLSAEKDRADKAEQQLRVATEDRAKATDWSASLLVQVDALKTRIAELEQQLAQAWRPWPPEGPEREVVLLTREGQEQRVRVPLTSEFTSTFRYAYRELTAEEKERANG